MVEDPPADLDSLAAQEKDICPARFVDCIRKMVMNQENSRQYWTALEAIDRLLMHDDVLRIKEAQIRHFQSNYLDQNGMGMADRIQCMLRVDVAILLLKDIWNTNRVLQTMSQSFVSFHSEVLLKKYTMTELDETVDYKVTERMEIPHVFLVRRYNINLYWARQYWVHKNVNREPGMMDENLYTLQKIEDLQRDRNDVAARPNPKYGSNVRDRVYGQVASSDTQTRALTIESHLYTTDSILIDDHRVLTTADQERALTIAAHVMEASNLDFDNQLEYCVMSAQSIGCSVAAASEEVVLSQPVCGLNASMFNQEIEL
jgi:hypothetical protein